MPGSTDRVGGKKNPREPHAVTRVPPASQTYQQRPDFCWHFSTSMLLGSVPGVWRGCRECPSLCVPETRVPGAPFRAPDRGTQRRADADLPTPDTLSHLSGIQGLTLEELLFVAGLSWLGPPCCYLILLRASGVGTFSPV